MLDFLILIYFSLFPHCLVMFPVWLAMFCILFCLLSLFLHLCQMLLHTIFCFLFQDFQVISINHIIFTIHHFHPYHSTFSWLFAFVLISLLSLLISSFSFLNVAFAPLISLITFPIHLSCVPVCCISFSISDWSSFVDNKVTLFYWESLNVLRTSKNIIHLVSLFFIFFLISFMEI